jgi:hypothetical protein
MEGPDPDLGFNSRKGHNVAQRQAKPQSEFEIGSVVSREIVPQRQIQSALGIICLMA